MTASENETTLEVPDELATLKARADLMGISYHPSIKLEKLREKLASAISSTPEEKGVPDVVAVKEEETEGAKRFRLRREANELVRIRVTCMNPAKAEWEGEIFTAGNSTVGSFSKFIPFNADEGWHVPRIILNQIQQRQCQIFVSVRDGRGNTTRKGKLIKEFAVELMPALTPKELADLAQRQAMAKTIA